jgi:hypothetical protein
MKRRLRYGSDLIGLEGFWSDLDWTGFGWTGSCILRYLDRTGAIGLDAPGGPMIILNSKVMSHIFGIANLWAQGTSNTQRDLAELSCKQIDFCSRLLEIRLALIF